jgi:hypothetical protein
MLSVGGTLRRRPYIHRRPAALGSALGLTDFYFLSLSLFYSYSPDFLTSTSTRLSVTETDLQEPH